MTRLASILSVVTAPSTEEWARALAHRPLVLDSFGAVRPICAHWKSEFRTAQAAWETLVARDLIPMAWVDDARVFLCPGCRGERGRVCHYAAQVGYCLFETAERAANTRQLPFPWSFPDLIGFAALSPGTILRAEELARALIRRLRPYRPMPDVLAWVSSNKLTGDLLAGPPVDEWHEVLQDSPEAEGFRYLSAMIHVERIDADRLVLSYPLPWLPEGAWPT